MGQSSLKVNHIALKVNNIVIVNETGVYHPLLIFICCVYIYLEIKDSGCSLGCLHLHLPI